MGVIGQGSECIGGFMVLQRRRARRTGSVMALMLVLASAALAQMPTPPLPPPRPDRPANSEPVDRAEKPPPQETPADKKDAEGDSARTACLDRLTQLGLRFEARPPV